VDGLNAAILSSVQQARAQGIRVRTADVTTPFTGHEVCGSRTPWLNGLLVTATGQPSTASFHPTVQGQQAYAAAVASALGRGGRPRS
jgi:hypothetical protein